MSDDPPRKKRPRPPTPAEMEVERAQTRRNGFIALGVLSVLMPALFFINLLRERHRHEEEMGLVPADTLSPEGGVRAAPHSAPLPVLHDEDELAITPEGVVKPSHHDVAFSIGSVLNEASACLALDTAGVRLSWQVNPDGSATDVISEGHRDAGWADAGVSATELECLVRNVTKARVAPFDGRPVHVAYTFRNAGKKP